MRTMNGIDLDRLASNLRFYACFIPIIFRDAHRARHGAYTDRLWAQGSIKTRRCLEKAGLKITVTGLDHIRALETPCIFIANHMSMLETVVLPGIVRPLTPVTFIVKESLVHYPIFKHVMISRNPVVVTRTDPRADFQTVMEEGKRRLDDGISMIVFPQTTRATAFDRTKFNSIGVKLARRANVPVIPIALRTDAWRLGKPPLKDLGILDPRVPAYFAFGAPIPVEGRGTAAHEQVLTFIESHLDAWGLPPVRSEGRAEPRGV